MQKEVTVEGGLRIAVRHPHYGAAILAKSIAKAIGNEDWITDELKLKFCILFVDNLIDGNIEKNIDRRILEKIKNKTFPEGLKLMKRRPEQGMRYMLVIIMEELRNTQGFSQDAQFAFYEELLSGFFPEYKVSDFIPDA